MEVKVLLPSQPKPVFSNLFREKEPITLSQLKKIQEQKQVQSGKIITNRCDVHGSYPLDVNHESQQTRAWCWAATSKMIMDYHNKLANRSTASQCDIASKILGPESGRESCCPDHRSRAIPDDCIKGEWPSLVFELYGFNYESVEQALDWESLTEEICSSGPFLYVVDFQGGGRHALIAAGYLITTTQEPNPTGTQLVKVYDPALGGFDYRTYNEFAGDALATDVPNGYYGMTHYRDYVQILPIAGGN